ncbi:site-specific integrase [Sphingomonas qomolangmaensis]|uniref:Integrase n=1 Tax=Sphingomonas qomolangmaensis TaxID=2918765 RepID=A0ABY5LDJ9_9SPHN|nr:hypothetical protein [Sphingomonas qomolangmaensis]UUL83966.1 hypothetical protein NMP03_07185 [Sphingomonas qomolangmaensis]
MASLQHIYRRGHIFWWRRVHFSFHNKPIDVRLSLGTPDRLQARNRGAALTASYDRVVIMLNQRMRAERDLTERELQKIARDMYEARLAELCTQQRAAPGDAELMSAANNAYVDYFERLARMGGHLSFMSDEEDRLRAEGWDERRVADLRQTIGLREERGITPIRRSDIDWHLGKAGLEPDDYLRWKVELALYTAYRDAYVDADRQLQSGSGFHAVEAPEPPPTPIPSGDTEALAIPERWRTCTPTQAAEWMIEETPRLLDHRRDGKRSKDSVGEQTLRQIRWAATLLEKSLPPGTPLWKVTKKEIIDLDRWFDQLPVHFGKSIHDRDPARSLEAAAADAVERIDTGHLAPEDVGFSTGTTNKHFNKLGQIHKFMRNQVDVVAPIDFGDFTLPIDEDEREARKRYTREQGEAIFRLALWTGCVGTRDRLQPGNTVIHDGLFFVLLLVWYTGARREELCKLMLDDIEERHGIAYILIRATETGRIKNKSARRVVVVADELVRLGFIRYVEAMRLAGETLLFPELMPGGDTKRKLGDVFYKLWWIYLKPLVPGLVRGQAMHSARHMVADELKDQEVFIEFRNDHLGHRGKGEGETRYPSAASLQRLRELVAKIPVVTSGIPDQESINLLPVSMRQARPTRQTSDR